MDTEQIAPARPSTDDVTPQPAAEAVLVNDVLVNDVLINDVLVEDVLVEEVSIDGMCGVY